MEAIYVQIDSELKKRTKKQAIDLSIKHKEYVILALEHYADHIENGDLDINKQLV